MAVRRRGSTGGGSGRRDVLTVGGLFDGAGLLAYGLHLAGLRHAWLCESDPFRRSLLERRWLGIPVFCDVRAVGARTAERVDVIAGGFPCKGASTAGKRQGFGHPETVLWREMARAVGELRPRFVVIENVANILALHGGALWGEVLGDLAALGFDVEWDCLPAAAFGAPHLRDRVFAVAAHPERSGLEGRGLRQSAPGDGGDASNASIVGAAYASGDGRGGRDARRVAALCDGEATPDAREPRRPAGRGGQSPRSRLGREGWRDEPGAAAEPTPDTLRDGVREQPEPEPRSGGEALARGSGAAAADAEGGPARRIGADPARRLAAKPHGGAFEPAIRRWEQVLGRPAPEPLVRGLDDGDAALRRVRRRVDRSRLSALGDGVLVQAGWLVGRYVLEREGALAP